MTTTEGALDRAIRGPFLDRLAGHDVASSGFPAFFAEFCARLVAAGIPVWRATLGLERLHPEEIGSMVVWRDGTLTRDVRPRAGILTSDAYLRSPSRSRTGGCISWPTATRC
jgi:hypothetical protein